ncbi:MAG: amidohydrolase family protein [Calditrichaeota bacterium]|nr:amidohydrolase family protein [Calditrichota bacterium]
MGPPEIGQRIEQSYRLASFVRGGAQVAIGTDWPVASLNPMLGLEAAAYRQIPVRNRQATRPEGGSGRETVSVKEAVRLYIGSAYAQGREHVKGTLTPGKLADFVVLDRNILGSGPQELREARVLMTVVGGEIVYES